MSFLIILYLGEIIVRVFVVHAEDASHERQSQWSWRVIWRIPVFDKICDKE